jgi:hypothetical protein
MKTFSTTTRKNITASLIAPLAVIPATILISCYSLIVHNQSFSKLISETLFLTFFSLVIAYPITFTVGFSSVFILKRFQYFNLVNTLLIALVIAFLFFVIFSNNVGIWLLSSYYSVVIALLYWYVFHKVVNKI